VLARVQELPVWKLFETRPFRLHWAGARLSMLADQAFLVALTSLVLQIAGPGAGLGAVLAGDLRAGDGPGAARRGDEQPVLAHPRHELRGRGARRAAGFAGGAGLTDATRLWHVYVLVGGVSALDALRYLTSMEMVPSLVDH
jgi:hypothetical protein